jgi:hypothetical protein
MACRFCERTRQIASTAWQRAQPHRPHFAGGVRPLEQLQIISRAPAGDRVVRTSSGHDIGRWSRLRNVLGRVLINASGMGDDG